MPGFRPVPKTMRKNADQYSILYIKKKWYFTFDRYFDRTLLIGRFCIKQNINHQKKINVQRINTQFSCFYLRISLQVFFLLLKHHMIYRILINLYQYKNCTDKIDRYGALHRRNGILVLSP